MHLIIIIIITYFGPDMCTKYCDEHVCMSVCLSSRICQKPHVQISRNFLSVLSAAVARWFSDDNGIRYVLPVLLLTSCFSDNGPHGAYRWQYRLGTGALLSRKFSTYSPVGAMLFDFVVVHNSIKLHTWGEVCLLHIALFSDVR